MNPRILYEIVGENEWGHVLLTQSAPNLAPIFFPLRQVHFKWLLLIDGEIGSPRY